MASLVGESLMNSGEIDPLGEEAGCECGGWGPSSGDSSSLSLAMSWC